MNGLNNPGVTLFNDGTSIQVANTSALQRAEEEEALEDQKRREAELAQQMQNAFDDLIDDDDRDDTLDSVNYLSNCSEHPGGSPPPLPIVPNPSTGQRFLDGIKPMQNGGTGGFIGDGQHVQEASHWRQMYQSKNREFEHVTLMMHEKSKEYEQKLNELKKRLLLAEGERDRANMTRSQTHDLLVESKTKISEQEDVIAKQQAKLVALENKNLELEANLENKKTLLQDAEHRYRMVEKNMNIKTDRHTEHLLKQSEEKHQAKVTMMQQQIDSLRSDLDDRCQELRRLDVRYKELESVRDQMIVEKNETIQRLQNSLDDSQHKCETLMTKTMNLTGMSQDNLRLQTKVGALEQQTQDMQRTINTLTQRLENSNAELELMDSVLCGGNATANETEPETTAHDTTPAGSCTFGASRRKLIGSTPLNPILKNNATNNNEERVAKLKQELLLCMNGQKEKRETIKRLETELSTRDKEIQQLKKDESHALVQMNQYKEEAFRVGSRIKILEAELEKALKRERRQSGSGSRRGSYDKQEALEDKIFQLRQEKDQLEDRLSQLEEENIRLSERNGKLEVDSKSLDTVKLELEKHKFLLKDSQGECERLKNLYVEISGAKDSIKSELIALRAQDASREVSALSERNASLERALQIAEMKSSELGKLLDREKLEHERLLRELGDRQDVEAKDKKTNSNSCTKCVDGLTKISKLEVQNLQLQNTCASHLREINDLKIALDESRSTIADLNSKLDLKAEMDFLIDELKQKSAQFKEFMRTQNSSANSSNTSSGNSSGTTKESATSPGPPVESRHQSVGTSPDLAEANGSESRKLAREQEHRIREEMARAFAVEIKVIEEKFKAQFHKFEESISSLKDELQQRTDELMVRSKEVDVLKYAIMTEREKMTEMLAKKDADARSLFDKQATLMKKYKSELNDCQRKINFLEGELHEKRELIASERESMEKLVRQVTDERKMFRERESEMIDKFKEIEQEYEKSLQLVTDKYNSVKKTALNYKKYAEDKEEHMMKEYDRIKDGYNTALLKVQNRMKEALDSKDRSMKERIAQMEAEYQSKRQGVST
ncbi:uncharacterized protein LOC129751782 [Uranotaenia lowii]|uniref:uncharacterized protein LOC129751782 n=1 Tax=Uranotaenia lowii TaxID=190385 RepID=UPI002478D757|nr:uncharacterized protein LOC129751782 [Uranotaenia lowii]